MKNLFRRKKYASPYYGGTGALNMPSAVPLRQDEDTTAAIERPQRVAAVANEPDWEQRRFELTKMLVAQDRRSVVLGKLDATDKQIAAKARSLADAAIKELQTHPMRSHDGRRQADDE